MATQRVEVKTKAAAEKAIKAGKPIRIVSGHISLAIADMSGVDIEIAASADVDISLTDVSAIVSAATRESSRVVARGSSSVVARESSRVEAWESSRVEAWGSSSVEAWGFAMLQVRSARCTVSAADTVAVNLWSGARSTGGRQFVVSQKTPQDWCDYYGVRVEGGQAIVYKAVGNDYVSSWGVKYTPGSTPKDPKWDGLKRECSAGGGLNFSPTPRHTHRFVSNPRHYLECRINLDDMVVHFDGQYPEKCCAPEVVSPFVEVDIDGNPIVSAEAA